MMMKLVEIRNNIFRAARKRMVTEPETKKLLEAIDELNEAHGKAVKRMKANKAERSLRYASMTPHVVRFLARFTFSEEAWIAFNQVFIKVLNALTDAALDGSINTSELKEQLSTRYSKFYSELKVQLSTHYSKFYEELPLSDPPEFLNAYSDRTTPEGCNEINKYIGGFRAYQKRRFNLARQARKLAYQQQARAKDFTRDLQTLVAVPTQELAKIDDHFSLQVLEKLFLDLILSKLDLTAVVSHSAAAFQSPEAIYDATIAKCKQQFVIEKHLIEAVQLVQKSLEEKYDIQPPIGYENSEDEVTEEDDDDSLEDETSVKKLIANMLITLLTIEIKTKVSKVMVSGNINELIAKFNEVVSQIPRGFLEINMKDIINPLLWQAQQPLRDSGFIATVLELCFAYNDVRTLHEDAPPSAFTGGICARLVKTYFIQGSDRAITELRQRVEWCNQQIPDLNLQVTIGAGRQTKRAYTNSSTSALAQRGSSVFVPALSDSESELGAAAAIDDATDSVNDSVADNFPVGNKPN